jgi:hypothetical protein
MCIVLHVSCEAYTMNSPEWIIYGPSIMRICKVVKFEVSGHQPHNSQCQIVHDFLNQPKRMKILKLS